MGHRLLRDLHVSHYAFKQGKAVFDSRDSGRIGYIKVLLLLCLVFHSQISCLREPLWAGQVHVGTGPPGKLPPSGAHCQLACKGWRKQTLTDLSFSHAVEMLCLFNAQYINSKQELFTTNFRLGEFFMGPFIFA